MIQELKKEFPNDIQVLVVEGRLSLVEGHYDAALAALEKAFELRHNNYMLIELVKAKMIAGQQEEGLAMMEKWLQEYPQDILVRTTLAEGYAKFGELEKASDQFRIVIERDPNDGRMKNRLARVFLELGRPHDAAPLAREAYELDPSDPAAADTLGVSLLKTGNKSEALHVLSAAREAAGDEEAIRLHFSEALAQNGKTSQAIAELQDLLQQAGDFPEREEAEKLLARLQD